MHSIPGIFSVLGYCK